MKKNMTARAEARKTGAKTYETGIPCKNGHVAPRATISGACTVCTNQASLAWQKRNKEKAAAHSAAYRERNRELVREKARIYAARARAENPQSYRNTRSKSYRTVKAREGVQVRDWNKLTISELEARLNAVHGARLVYVGGYQNMLTDAEFACVEHGVISRAHPHNVLRGANPCPKCNHMKSAPEDALARFLSIFTKVEQRNRTILKPKELDIYLPDDKLAVEYCGMHWHSHKDREDERKNKLRHYEKFKACAEQGIRLITIYETDWKENPRAIKRLLRNAIGKSKGKLMARKCELRKVTNKEAAVFYDRYHPQGGAGHGEHYALFWKGKMVACMRFVLGANDRGAGAANRVWTLGRYATRVNVAGAASRLFKAFVAEHNPPEVKSFSDNRLFGGGMYEKLGFVLEENVAPDYQVWSQKLGLRPKPHYQRRQLQKRLREHGFDETYDHLTDPRTEAEMTYYMGARRIYDCGKKRWLWTPQ